MQFQVIVVTDPPTHIPTNTQTHKQDQLQYTAQLSLARSVIVSSPASAATDLVWFVGL